LRRCCRNIYGISSSAWSNLDPLTFACAVGLFLYAAFIAALFPLRRALRVDPLLALRAD